MNSASSTLQMTPIHIIGLGVSEQAELSAPAQAALLCSDYVYGSARQLSTISGYINSAAGNIAVMELPKLPDLKQRLQQRGQNKITVLASGDPLYYGIGGWFSRHFLNHELVYHAAVSSVQSACHRLGLSLQDVNVVSLHGRPLATLRRELKPNTTLAILTDATSNPRALAEECVLAGLGQSRITVCENLGYSSERIRSFSTVALLQSHLNFEPLHISIIELLGESGPLPQFPGFEDRLFETGAQPGSGMISKREVRLQILSYLQPGSADLIWDIGAGCGGVAVELAYWNTRTRVYAIEQHPQRLTCLHINQQRFGVLNNLDIVAGRAPQCLAELPSPNKIFIGGSDGELTTMLELCWEILPTNGILVASAVTENTRQQLFEFSQRIANCQAEYVAITVRRGTLTPDGWSNHGKRPVEIFKFKKREEAQ